MSLAAGIFQVNSLENGEGENFYKSFKVSPHAGEVLHRWYDILRNQPKEQHGYICSQGTDNWELEFSVTSNCEKK